MIVLIYLKVLKALKKKYHFLLFIKQKVLTLQYDWRECYNKYSFSSVLDKAS